MADGKNMKDPPSKEKIMDRPSLKISQTFIDFVKPVMPPIDENTTEDQIRTFFELGFMVWNAVLLDSVNKNTFYKGYIEGLLSQTDVPLSKIC